MLLQLREEARAAARIPPVHRTDEQTVSAESIGKWVIVHDERLEGDSHLFSLHSKLRWNMQAEKV